MRYTKDLILAHLKKLGITSWDWAGNKPGKIRQDLRAQNPRLARAAQAGRDGGVHEIAEYCWAAYSKSLNSGGDLVIGRQDHLEKAGLYSKVAEIVGDKTLFDSGSHGNLLKMDKWACVMNDAWILGGVHRQGLFRLASPRVMDNLWHKDGRFVVTAREILGLLNFGYALEQIGPWQCLACNNKDNARTADLLKYDALIKTGQTIKKAQELEDKVGSGARVKQQVQAFHNR